MSPKGRKRTDRKIPFPKNLGGGNLKNMQRDFLAGRSAGLPAQAAGLNSALRAKIGSSESVKTYQKKPMMINFDVPFCENTDDDTHCFQACLKMVLGYFLPERHFSWQALDQMTNKRSGEPTWPMAGVCWLVENGFDVQYIELFDYRKFLEKKSAYLCERWSEDMANYALETDIESEMPYVESFINTVRYKNRIASLNDVKHALKDGFICILNVNVRSLYNNEGYSGHYIVIKGIDKNEFIIHDPGRPGKKDQKVSFIQLQNGWSYPNKTSNNLLAIKL